MLDVIAKHLAGGPKRAANARPEQVEYPIQPKADRLMQRILKQAQGLGEQRVRAGVERGADERKGGDARGRFDGDVRGDFAPEGIPDEVTSGDSRLAQPGDHGVGKLWNREYLRGSFAAAETRQVERVDLVADRKTFGERNHVETGDHETMNQHERDAGAG